MLFLVDVKKANHGWTVQVSDPRDEVASLLERSLESQPGQDGVFPLPPNNMPPLPENWTPADLEVVYNELMSQGTGPVQAFGRYLFDVLLGQDTWEQITSIAEGQRVELALTWDPTDHDLNRLPWEIMHSDQPSAPGRMPSTFLAAQPGVTITRRVESTFAENEIKLPTPPRVLFVVGAGLDDAEILPGAEYFGLLRNLRFNNLNRHLRTMILLNATTTRLVQAIKAFTPSVVHFIGHGTESISGEVQLEFRHEDDPTRAVGVRTEQLLACLRTDKNLPLPTVIVLNACSTAISTEMAVSRPMAAELVSGGVPVVVGMSGQVSDQACRLFAKGFYRALLEGGEIAQAAARGRWYAITHSGDGANRDLNWGLPTLFLASNVGEAHLSLEERSVDIGRENLASAYLVGEGFPVFCGHWRFFQVYTRLMLDEDRQYLAISSEGAESNDRVDSPDHYGRTRLLRELAAQAVRDHHVPVLITKDLLQVENNIPIGDGEIPWPGEFLDFINQVILSAAQNTRDYFINHIPAYQDLNWSWNYFPHLANLDSQASLPDGFPDEFRQDSNKKPTDIVMLARAFRIDLISLLDEVNSKLPETKRKSSRLVLLVDDVHQLGNYLNSFLTLLFDARGLRRASPRIKVIFTYRNGSDIVDIATAITDRFVPGLVQAEKLETLHRAVDPENTPLSDEEFLRLTYLYCHYLMNWQYQGHSMPLSLSRDKDKEAYVKWIVSEIASKVAGYPSRLKSEDVTSQIRTFSNMPGGILRDANDEDALRALGWIQS